MFYRPDRPVLGEIYGEGGRLGRGGRRGSSPRTDRSTDLRVTLNGGGLARIRKVNFACSLVFFGKKSAGRDERSSEGITSLETSVRKTTQISRIFERIAKIHDANVECNTYMYDVCLLIEA